MPGYVLYFPKIRGADPEHFDRSGISVLKDGSIEFADFEGPDRKSGVLAFWSRPNRSPVLEVERYNWTAAVPDGELPAGRFFIGIPTDGISPKDLERKTIQPGYTFTLADGNVWAIPVAAYLPHRHGLSPEGEHIRSIMPQFKDYWDQSQQYAAQLFEAMQDVIETQRMTGKPAPEVTKRFTLADTWKFCVTALSINYRLNADLVSLLGLLDDGAMANICKAACDLPVLMEVATQKKTEHVSIPVGSST